jgi:hypothetical protein
MSSNKQAPAFPLDIDMVDRMSSLNYSPEGLTKREYIAIEAMKAMLSNDTVRNPGMHRENIVNNALSFADEMLKQLEEK